MHARTHLAILTVYIKAFRGINSMILHLTLTWQFHRRRLHRYVVAGARTSLQNLFIGIFCENSSFTQLKPVRSVTTSDDATDCSTFTHECNDELRNFKIPLFHQCSICISFCSHCFGMLACLVACLLACLLACLYLRTYIYM